MASAAIVKGSDKFRSPFWATKIFSVWLTTLEFIELVLTSLTIEVDEVASPVLIDEPAEERFDLLPLSRRLDFAELSSAEGVASSVALPVLMMVLSPLLASD